MRVIVSAVKKRLQTIVFRSYPENAAHGCPPVWFLMGWFSKKP
jgi:hypothetical protein